MDRLTTDRLMEILRECAGDGDATETDRSPEDIEFASLGYDSLAMLETLSRLEREFGVALDEQEFAAAGTPAELTTLVNRVLAEAA
ncbi:MULTISPECIES: acyl carrier protein [Streptomyces]|uniref:Acyl carrier protein n=2 Tax=Streptomyces TaxID=1883 RepID=A0ABU4KHU6_9ACTN|nr:acyl carrier protein [Streptomyces roseolus]MDX2297301.1 acyl carrier protein [Streptomyces roseolus]